MPDIIGGLVAIGFLILWLYCIYDVIVTDDSAVRNLPKMVWLMIVLLIPDIGSILWLGLGRPGMYTRRATNPGRYGSVPKHGSDRSDEESMSHLSPIVRFREEQARLKMREEQLNRREEELRRREFDGGTAE